MQLFSAVVWASLAQVALATGQICAHEGGRPDFLTSGMLSERQFRENMHLSSEDLPMSRCRPARVDVRPEGLAPVMANLRSFGDAVPGFSYYKLNTCGPNGSWAVVDWYGNPTVAYWWVKAFLNPVLAATRLPTFNFYDKKPKTWKVPVRLVDDFGLLSPGAKARVRVFDERLAVVAEVADGGRLLSRTWVPCNYDRVRGSLFALPNADLRLEDGGKGKVVVRNEGPVSAVGVELSAGGHGDILHLSDNWFWLDPGEAREVDVSFEDGKTYPVAVTAFNMQKEGN